MEVRLDPRKYICDTLTSRIRPCCPAKMELNPSLDEQVHYDDQSGPPSRRPAGSSILKKHRNAVREWSANSVESNLPSRTLRMSNNDAPVRCSPGARPVIMRNGGSPSLARMILGSTFQASRGGGGSPGQKFGMLDGTSKGKATVGWGAGSQGVPAIAARGIDAGHMVPGGECTGRDATAGGFHDGAIGGECAGGKENHETRRLWKSPSPPVPRQLLKAWEEVPFVAPRSASGVTAADPLRLAAPIMSREPLSPGTISAQPTPVSPRPHIPNHTPLPTTHNPGPQIHKTLQFTSQPRLLLFDCSLLHCARSRS